MRNGFSIMQSTLNDRTASMTGTVEEYISSALKSLEEKVEPLPNIKDMIKMSRSEVDKTTSEIIRRQDDLDNAVHSVHEICSGFNTFRLQDTEDKREKHREMSKQITALSELAQHAQVTNAQRYCNIWY